jgi:hypothetical protein
MRSAAGILGFVKKHAVVITTMVIIGIFLLVIDHTQKIITPEQASGSVVVTFAVVWLVFFIYNRLKKR